MLVREGTVVDDDRVVLVGATDGPPGADDSELKPNGWLIDLTKRTAPKRFTNGHSAPLWSVSAGHGMVATTSTSLDPVLRVSDLSTGGRVAEVKLGEPDLENSASFRYSVRWLSKTPRLAVQIDREIHLLDPKTPSERVRHRVGTQPGRAPFSKIAVSPNDTRIGQGWTVAVAGVQNWESGVNVWSIGTTEPAGVIVNTPKEHEKGRLVHGVVFTRTDDVLAWRIGPEAEVTKGMAEKDAPADRRGIVRIDLAGKRVVPTGMGLSRGVSYAAIDPSGEWLALVGHAHPDGPNPENKRVISELRVYHVPNARLVYREQIATRDGFYWVGYSPSGRRLCAATVDGVLFWWDVTRPEPRKQ